MIFSSQMNRLCLILALILVSSTLFAGQNVVVVLDDSGSMDDRMRRSREKKIDSAKQALEAVLEQLPADARVGVLLLNGTVNGSPWAVPMGPVNIGDVRQALRRVRAVGGTPLGAFVKDGADALLELRERQHYGEYRLLIVTDGEATDPERLDRYLPDILSRGLTVDVIGVDMKSDHSLATQVNSYRRADDPQSLEVAIREVFAETSDQDDASEAEFELLEGFPSEIAAAAIAALSETDNGPIGEGRRARVDSAVEPGGAPPEGAMNPANRPRDGNDWLVVMFVVVLIYLLLSRLGRAVRRGDRSRR